MAPSPRMEIKSEPVDQSYETTTTTTPVSIMQMYTEMSEKFGKLQQEFIGLRNEMTELRKENAEMKVEIAKLKEGQQNHQRNDDLERQQQQSQLPIMDMENSQQNNDDRFDDYPAIDGTQNEFIETDQPSEQNVDNNTFDLAQNVVATAIIKQECEIAEIEGANCQIQMQTTSSSNWNNYEEIVVGVERSSQNIENDDDVVMNLDRDEENGKSENAQQKSDKVEEQIKCVPIRIGGMLKCNWPECKFRSMFAHYLQIHFRTHTGERPFVCMECGQSFAHPGSLKRHSLIHSGEKPFRCDICGKSYKTSQQLNEHVRNHTGEKPYLCKECKNNKSFKTSEGLRKHRRSWHGNPFACKKCGQIFAQSMDLAIHKQLMKH